MKIWINEPTLGLPVPNMMEFNRRMPVNKANPLHFDGFGATIGGSPVSQADSTNMDFGSMLIKGLDVANRAQLDASYLSEKVISDPSSVQAHEVTTAMAKANMSLSIAKSVIDRTITSFREILSQR
ncbi:MAG: flagellar hook-basal body complex protein FliE [Spirochaetia bacterium]